MNLKHCPGCTRDLPRHLFPRAGSTCLACLVDGPGEKDDIMNTPLNVGEKVEEMVYVKHEEELKQILKDHPDGLSTKEIADHLEITRDATYALCKTLHEENKIGMSKEQRGAGRAQNIYHLKQVKGIAAATVRDPVDTLKEVQKTSTNHTVQLPLNPWPGWEDYKNRLIEEAQKSIPTKQPGLVEALYLMIRMEREHTEKMEATG